jgi:hypothetical protein
MKNKDYLYKCIIGVDLAKDESYTIEKEIKVVGVTEDGWLLVDYIDED